MRNFLKFSIIIILIIFTGCARISRLNVTDQESAGTETQQETPVTGQETEQEAEEQKEPASLTKRIITAPFKLLIGVPKFIITLPFRPFMSKSEPEEPEPAPPVRVFAEAVPGAAETQPGGQVQGPVAPGTRLSTAAAEQFSSELKQISSELKQISAELKQITSILRKMTRVEESSIPARAPEIPGTVPDFTQPDSAGLESQIGAAVGVPVQRTPRRKRNIPQPGQDMPQMEPVTTETKFAEVESLLLALESETTEIEPDSVEPEPMELRAYYDIMLRDVERPARVQEDFGSGKTDVILSDGVEKQYFEDSMITAVWDITAREIHFILTNNSDDSLAVIWDDAVFVDEHGENHTVIHSKINYANRNRTQPPTILEKGESLTDILFPRDYIIFHKTVGWLEYPLLPYSLFDLRTKTRSTEEEFTELANQYVGKSFRIILPFHISGVVHEYQFVFEIAKTTLSMGK